MKNYGLILDKVQEQDYVLGGLSGLPKEVLIPSGQWDNLLPLDEFQATEVESMACVTFGTLNCCEILLETKGIKNNFSDRWLAWNSGTTQNGNSPQTVAETLRKAGVPKDEEWPVTHDIESWEDFYKNPPPKLFETAREQFLTPYEFSHEWVPTDHNSLKEGLQYSPLGVAVYAWISNGEYYIRPEGTQPNHWCVLYGYEEGKYWKILDSYDLSKKKLEWNYNFAMAKRYFIKKKLTETEIYKQSGKNWFTQIINHLKAMFTWS